jgi:hypothetical protein
MKASDIGFKPNSEGNVRRKLCYEVAAKTCLCEPIKNVVNADSCVQAYSFDLWFD